MKTNLRPTPQDRRAARVRALSHAVSGALVAAAFGTAAALSDTPIAALLAALLLLTAAFVVADPGNHLLATAAPLPDVHTPPIATATGLIRMVQVDAPTRLPRVRPYVDELLGTAEDVGVYVPRHASHTPTRVIPQVTA